MVEEKTKSEAVSFGIGLLVIIIAEAIIGILSPDGILGIIVFLGLSPLIIFLVWYFYWVPRNIFGTFPDSGFDTPLEKGKTLVGQVTACSNHDVDPLDGTLKKKKDIKPHYSPRFNIAGAVPFWWPIVKVRPTKLKYGKNIPIKTGEPLEKSVEIKETIVNKVSLKWYPFGILTDWVEISGNARARARITWVGRLLNYEDANINNTNVIMTISNEIVNQFRGFSADMEFNDLKKIRDNEGAFEETLKLIQGLARIYGMEIKTIMMTDIELHPEDQAAFRKQLQAQKDADARITSAEAESKVLKIMGVGKQQARALETMGAVTHQISLICGITPEKVPAMMNDPEFRKFHNEEIKAALRFVEQSVSADAGALIHFLTSGAQSTGGSGTNFGGLNSEAIAYVVGLIKALNMPAVNGQLPKDLKVPSNTSEYSDRHESKKKTNRESDGSQGQMKKYIEMSKDPNSGYYGINPYDIRDHQKAMKKEIKDTDDDSEKKKPELSSEQKEALEEKGLLED